MESGNGSRGKMNKVHVAVITVMFVPGKARHLTMCSHSEMAWECADKIKQRYEKMMLHVEIEKILMDESDFTNQLIPF